MQPRRLAPFAACLALVALLGVAGCAPGVDSNAGPSAGGAPDGPVLAVVAENVEFSPKRVQLPAGVAIHVTFRNLDSGIPHNVTLQPLRSGVVAPVLHESEVIVGPMVDAWDLEPLAPGPYLFSCSVHPNMQIEAEAV